jgi:sugar phosphate isomerase/epimerase
MATLCVFSKHLNWLTIPELAQALTEIGFDGVDLAVRPGGHVEREKVESDLPRAVELLAKQGVRCPSIVTAITKADKDAERVIRTAAGCGVKVYRMGYLHYGESVEQTLSDARTRFASLAELNEKHGIHGAYQNHVGTDWVGASIWDLHRVLDGLPSKWIGCQYDVRHAVVESGSSWSTALRLISPWIRSVVIKDGHWHQNDEGRYHPVSVPVGTGMVDWSRYCELLPQSPWDGLVSVHYEYPLLDRPAEELSRDEVTRQTIAGMRQELTSVKQVLAPLL